MEMVWDEDAACYSRKAVSNHVSNLRKKLKITPDGLEYIKILSVSVINLKYHNKDHKDFTSLWSCSVYAPFQRTDLICYCSHKNFATCHYLIDNCA